MNTHQRRQDLLRMKLEKRLCCNLQICVIDIVESGMQIKSRLRKRDKTCHDTLIHNHYLFDILMLTLYSPSFNECYNNIMIWQWKIYHIRHILKGLLELHIPRKLHKLRVVRQLLRRHSCQRLQVQRIHLKSRSNIL